MSLLSTPPVIRDVNVNILLQISFVSKWNLLEDQGFFKQPFLEGNLQDDKKTHLKLLSFLALSLQFWCLSKNKHLFLPHQLKMILKLIKYLKNKLHMKEDWRSLLVQQIRAQNNSFTWGNKFQPSYFTKKKRIIQTFNRNSIGRRWSLFSISLQKGTKKSTKKPLYPLSN